MVAKACMCLLLAVGLALAAPASAQTYGASARRLLRAIDRQPTLLARCVYLRREMPSLSASDRILAQQFRSFAQDELGLYNQAVMGFPLKATLPAHLVLPDTARWRGRNAVDVIARQARGRHIVMINEAHHDAHTRVLTLALLPRLRALGFTYFAAEALSGDDPHLMQRGYPVKASGSEYLREPIYGEIVREAIRLGFIIVPYDIGRARGQAREDAQADTLYRAVFVQHPRAKLVVHAGYAHIDKAPGRLGPVRPMAMRLRRLTGFEPLSIDQTDVLETRPHGDDAYHRLIARFPTDAPEVLVNRTSGAAWSDRPALYDMNVILPHAVDMRAFGSYAAGSEAEGVSLRMPERDHFVRPRWLHLHGQRRAFAIDSTLCRGHIPCVVEAHYAGESADASAADRYAFMHAASSSDLYLRPGRYRMRAVDAGGRAVAAWNVNISAAGK